MGGQTRGTVACGNQGQRHGPGARPNRREWSKNVYAMLAVKQEDAEERSGGADDGCDSKPQGEGADRGSRARDVGAPARHQRGGRDDEPEEGNGKRGPRTQGRRLAAQERMRRGHLRAKVAAAWQGMLLREHRERARASRAARIAAPEEGARSADGHGKGWRGVAGRALQSVWDRIGGWWRGARGNAWHGSERERQPERKRRRGPRRAVAGTGTTQGAERTRRHRSEWERPPERKGSRRRGRRRGRRCEGNEETGG